MAIDTTRGSGDAGLRLITLIGPYFEWLRSTGYSYYRTQDGVWLPVLFELAEPAKLFARGKLVDGESLKPGWKKWLRIPGAYANPPAGLEDHRFCTAWLYGKSAEAFVRDLARGGSLAKTIIGMQLGAPGPAPKASPRVAHLSLTKAHPRHVVAAVIDDGIAFAHERFRRSDGTTRFAYMWDQNGSAGVSGFGFGHESTGAEIDAETKLGVVAEDEVYRNLQYVDYSLSQHQALGRRVSHGTIAADLAFGLVPRNVPPGKLPMIGVRLEDAATEDTSGIQLKLPVIEALIYTLLRADQIAFDAQCGPLPVVATLSYGYIAGPHDGCSLFERAIDSILSLRSAVAPMRLVLPAGNWYLARCHAHVEITAKSKPSELRWRVLPDDATGTFMEIWAVAEDPKVSPEIEVRVTDPRGKRSAWGLGPTANPPVGPAIWTINSTPTTASDRVAVLLWIAPTTALDPKAAIAPSGTYKVEVRNRGTASCSVNAWIQRDDRPFGYPIRGRQSYFDDPRYERFKLVRGDPQEVDNTSYVKRFGTVNAMATSNHPIVIGGFRRSDRTASRYSAAGPTNALPKGIRTTPRKGLDPDALAISEDSVTLHGVLGAGSRSGSVVAMNGTSMAVPQIARKVWEHLRAGASGDRAFVRSLAKAEEVATPKPRILPQRRGYGRITVEPVAPAPRFPGAQPIKR